MGLGVQGGSGGQGEGGGGEWGGSGGVVGVEVGLGLTVWVRRGLRRGGGNQRPTSQQAQAALVVG